MDRVAIVGCGGSGKSHLARGLGEVLGITPVHLDACYYDQDWRPLDQEAFAAVQRELVAAPRWIIDGNYAATVPSGSGPPTRCCSWTCRAGPACWGSRSGSCATAAGSTRQAASTTGSPGTSPATSPATGWAMAPRVRALIAEHAGGAHVVILRSRRAARRYLATVPSPLSGTGG